MEEGEETQGGFVIAGADAAKVLELIEQPLDEVALFVEFLVVSTLGFDIEVDAATIEELVREGYHRTLGARPMRNTVDRFLQERIARKALLRIHHN